MSAANMENARTAASLKEAEQACRSGLPSGSDMPDPFVLLDSITHWDAQGLEAETHLNGAWWEALEAAAQACAYHQRWRTNFGDHAFLLSLDRVGFANASPVGKVRVLARLTGQAGRSAGYTVLLNWKCCGHACEEREGDGKLAVELTVGHVPYADEEQGRRLSGHYRGCWACLSEGR